MILVAAAIAAAVAVGIAAERRFGARAQAASRTTLKVVLYGLLPFIVFFSIAALRITVGVGAGLGLAGLSLLIVGIVAWVVTRRLMSLPRPVAGATIVSAIQVNTGYLGVPLVAALLGTSHIGEAIAFDAIVSGPMLYGGAFAIGAAFGTEVGESWRQRALAFLTRNPPLIALVAGLLAPKALAPHELVSVAHVAVIALAPLGFFVVGVNLAAEAEDGALPFPPPLAAPVRVALALRLVLAPLLLLALAAPLIALPRAYLIEAAMPSGINGLVVAHAYGLDLKVSASAIAWSTAIVVVVATVVALA